MDDLILLVATGYETNNIGVQVPEETTREVWATLKSISRQEAFEASTAGLNPQFVARMPIVNYLGERTAVIKGKRYGIYRTYIVPDSDSIEIYLEEKAGVYGNSQSE